MDNKKVSQTTNKFSAKNEYDVEIAKISYEEKKIDLKIEEIKSATVLKQELVSGIVKIISVIGSVVSGILAWKGECKIEIPSYMLWWVLIVILVLLVIISLVFGIAWHLERKGKKRAIEEKQKYQKIVESSDKYRSSSGLTKKGDTPKGKDK